MPALGLDDKDAAADNASMTRLIDKFMSAGALPGSNKVFEITAGPDGLYESILEAWQAYSFVEEVAEGQWRLTQSGLDEIRVSSRISEGSPALAVRDVPVREKSSFECLLCLCDSAWSWRPLPHSAQDRATLRYEILPATDVGAGGAPPPPPKVFYTSLTSQKEYLQCLLLASELADADGSVCIPHGRPKEVYVKLLNGQRWVHIISIDASRSSFLPSDFRMPLFCTRRPTSDMRCICLGMQVRQSSLPQIRASENEACKATCLERQAEDSTKHVAHIGYHAWFMNLRWC
jgi:hypothetical protein